MTISQQVVYEPSSNDTKVVPDPVGQGTPPTQNGSDPSGGNGTGNPPTSGTDNPPSGGGDPTGPGAGGGTTTPPSGDGGGTSDGGGLVIGVDPILTVGVGNGEDGSGLSVNVLTPPDPTDSSGLNLNVIDTGDGKNLLDVGLLPNAGDLGLPGLGGTSPGGDGSVIGLDPLLTVGLGGEDNGGLSVNVLTPPDATDSHGINLNLVDTGDGQNLLDVGLLPNNGDLSLPGLGGAGSDNPLGSLLGADGLLGNPIANLGSGGLLSGTVGALTGSSSGHLIDLDVGPETQGGLGLDLLASPGTDPGHGISVNAIDVGANGPQLLDLGVLTGTGGIIDVPALGGAGTDGLTGNLLGDHGLVTGLLGGSGLAGGVLGGDIASGNTTTVPVNAPLDITALTDVVTAPLAGDHGILDLHGAQIL